jgi:putative nucleotidyltransferase with HDIG domain
MHGRRKMYQTAVNNPDQFHIMVVDDNDTIRDTVRQTVEIDGYLCSTAASGVDALKILENENVDVIITDIRMPGLSGIEITKKVKKVYDTDVIVMTGFAEDFTYEKIIEIGASDFFQKPVSAREIMLRLKRVLKERVLFKERKQADEALKISFNKLKRAHEQTVAALVSMNEIRDPYTSGHQLRVSRLSCQIAEHMGLSADMIDGIRIAGLLHDIGKISVPVEILIKPGKITKEEFNIIKEHPRIGYNILKEIEFPWPVAKIVFQHHERVDGSGYPLELQGEEILLEAKIIAVADIVEAMSSHRPYRPAFGLDKALDEINQQREIIFDPMVVDACLGLASSADFKFE